MKMLVCTGVIAAAAVMFEPPLQGQIDPNAGAQTPQSMSGPGSQTSSQPGMQPGTPTTPGGQSPAGSTMRDSLGAPGMTGQQMMDKQFMQKAAQGGVAEVKLGMLATQKGGPEVKEFGQKMVDDHTAINKDMATVADEMGVMLPKKLTKDDQAEWDKLNGLSGDAFDKEYIAYMVKDHRQDMHDFRSEAAVAADPGLQAEAVKASLVIREHLMMVIKLANEKGVPVPPRPDRSAAPPPAAK